MSNNQVNILAFAGSTRADSFNKKLVKIAAQGAKEQGAEVTVIDLRDFPMPLYDGDLEGAEGLPENALKLKALMRQQQGFLIASPEYNSGYSAVLKNSIDWVSRVLEQGEPPLVAFSGKTASIMSASPGALGGLRGLYQLRELLMNINVTVLPTMRAIGGAMKEFDEHGNLVNAELEKAVKKLGEQTVRAISGG